MCGLVDLALMTSLDIPLDVGLECWPPEAIEERTANIEGRSVMELNEWQWLTSCCSIIT